MSWLFSCTVKLFIPSLDCFSCYCDKNTLEKANQRRKYLHCFIIWGYSPSCWESHKQQNLGAPDDVASTVRKEWCVPVPALFLHLLQFRISSQEICHPQWLNLLFKISLLEIIPYSYSQRLISHMILDFFFHLTIEIKHHIPLCTFWSDHWAFSAIRISIVKYWFPSLLPSEVQVQIFDVWGSFYSTLYGMSNQKW